MPTLWITIGLPGSGKTTHARGMLAAVPLGSLVRLNRDDLRRMALPGGYRKPVRAAEELITVMRDAALVALLAAGRDVIVDDTNLRPEYVQHLVEIGRSVGADVRTLGFSAVPLDVCVLRRAARPPGERVGEKVIRRMAAQWDGGPTNRGHDEHGDRPHPRTGGHAG